ncbi:ankyrin repeat domain-containing protein [Muricauda sp. CAU 1633]|uniref:ankyrin repeat domain-containing protein n=1 Tax=Allomuricauda sp. CAU 1633 TaxID=2816036 RepID=UPI001A8DE4D5|nr:ankyrin repeat domain-containing protein [Muricauda sp. CAU 1633]MBO0322619.1 ankyrin repeat domain-containing protein [Muricauda sp. CAU 1633]
MKKTILTVAAFCMLVATGVSANEPISDVNLNVSALPVEVNSFCKAIMQGDVETVKKLIELGEDVNEKSLGMAPVHFAARYNQAEILSLLIENGANFKRRSDQGYTAKKYAEMSNATEALAVLEDAMKK